MNYQLNLVFVLSTSTFDFGRDYGIAAFFFFLILCFNLDYYSVFLIFLHFLGVVWHMQERMRKLEISQQTAVIHTVHSEGVLSNTPHPIQEQAIESTNTEESPLVGTPPQGEASMNYEDFFGKLLIIAMETETLIFYFV